MVLTTILIVAVTACMVASQLLLKRAVDVLGAPSTLTQLVEFFFGAMLTWWMLLAVVLQLTGFALWLVVASAREVGRCRRRVWIRVLRNHSVARMDALR